MEKCLVICRAIACTLAAVALAATAGCGSSDYDVAPVSGTVLLNGEPFPQGKVMFAPAAADGGIKAGKPGFGDLQSDGRFVISTYGNQDGAVVAEHTVTVINTEPKSDAGRRFAANRVSLPSRVRVEPGKANDFTVELTSDMIKKYGMRID